MDNMKNRKGVVGFGNMGRAIAQRINPQYRVFVFDKDRNKTKNLDGIKVADNSSDLVDKVDALILAVKPQDLLGVLNEIKNYVKDKLIISIAAGITCAYIEKVIKNARVIRVMPNIGAKIGGSVSCLCAGVFASGDDLDFAEELFYNIGVTRNIDEGMMNTATAISGSGPAYIFDFVEANSMDPCNVPEHARHDMIKRLERAAKTLGFSHEDAMFLAANTLDTSINLMAKTKIAPKELKMLVASKGGTTEKALEVLRKGGSWEEAAQAALKRAEELSR